jgi:CBS domain-containing protein
VAGPLVSLVLAAAGACLLPVTGDGTVARTMIFLLVWSNLAVAVFNLLPGLPLDGGRVLKAAVWRVSGNVHRGTLAAGWGGRVAAALVLAWPLAQYELLREPPTLLDFVLTFVVALFLWSGATAAMASARLRSRLPSLVARDLARRTLTVPEDLPLAEAVRRAQEDEAGSIVTVTGAGRPAGIVSEAALLATPEDRRPWVSVSSVARTANEGLTLPAGIGGEQLILAISRHPAPEYLLLEDDGHIYGVLSTADVDKAFRAAHR